MHWSILVCRPKSAPHVFRQNPRAQIAHTEAEICHNAEMTFSAALHAFQLTDSNAKAAAVFALDIGAFVPHAIADDALLTPGFPAHLQFVSPQAVPQRALSTPPGRAALLHAIAHIEYNAIHLALDAALRFPKMPHAYYEDWLQVAKEEALHFSLLAAHLAQHYKTSYGDFPVHNGLWEMAARTQGDVLARIALVPRVLEARGLDVTPAIAAKLRQAGDLRSVEILDIILRDEIGHVAIGNKWYASLCEAAQCDPIATFAQLRTKYRAPPMRPPFNLDARRRAGFTELELKELS